jgi:hypothetical protein
MSSVPASRDRGVEGPPPLGPPPDALLVVRPTLSLFRPKQWIALTEDRFEARNGPLVAVLRRSEIQAVALGWPVRFLGAGGRVLATVAPVYRRSQIDKVAAALGVRVLGP